MRTDEIANILHNMSLDMDYAEDQYNEEIELLTKEIEKLKDQDSPLYYALGRIAENNKDMLDWALRQSK